MNSLTFKELKELSTYNSSSVIAEKFGFVETLKIAKSMLNNEAWDESLQEFAVKLLEELRIKYPEVWNSNWKYDGFLGYAYDITMKYDERYMSYQRALNKVNPPPPQLLVAMAGCCWAPGSPPITETEAIAFVRLAIKSILYKEGVELLIGLYKSMGNAEEQKRWEQILDRMDGNAPHLPSLDWLEG